MEEKLRIELERKMLPRMNFLGGILLLFSLATVAYITFSEIVPEENFALSFEELAPTPPLILTPKERTHFYLYASSFALTSLSCFVIARTKKKELA